MHSFEIYYLLLKKGKSIFFNNLLLFVSWQKAHHLPYWQRNTYLASLDDPKVLFNVRFSAIYIITNLKVVLAWKLFKKVSYKLKSENLILPGKFLIQRKQRIVREWKHAAFFSHFFTIYFVDFKFFSIRKTADQSKKI